MSRIPPYRFAGRTAVVTGAASGIGEQLAYRLGAKGSDLVLLDRDAPRLDAVAARIRDAHPGITVEALVVDLADRAATAELAERIAREHPRVGLLVNNAGAGLGGRFDQVTLDDFDWIMDVNFRAAVVLTHALLPSLLAEPGSHVANTSSVYGLYAPPGDMAYASSKFALRGFSQSLRAELAPRGVGVTTVHPGGVRTRVVENSRIADAVDPKDAAAATQHLAKLLTYPPEKAADEILAGIEARKGRVLISSSAKVPDAATRLFPVSHLRVIDWLARALERQDDRRVARASRAAADSTDGADGPGGVDVADGSGGVGAVK